MQHYYVKSLRLKYYLGRHGYPTVRSVSDKLGKSYTYVANILRGTCAIPVKMIPQIAKLANVDSSKFIEKSNY